MVCCMNLTCLLLEMHSKCTLLSMVVEFGFFCHRIFACPPQPGPVGSLLAFMCWFVLFLIFWRGRILIKICSVFSFLISLVADPSSPLYLIVSCGKFCVFRASFSFPFIWFFLNINLKVFTFNLKSEDPNHCFSLAPIKQCNVVILVLWLGYKVYFIGF